LLFFLKIVNFVLAIFFKFVDFDTKEGLPMCLGSPLYDCGFDLIFWLFALIICFGHLLWPFALAICFGYSL